MKESENAEMGFLGWGFRVPTMEKKMGIRPDFAMRKWDLGFWNLDGVLEIFIIQKLEF